MFGLRSLKTAFSKWSLTPSSHTGGSIIKASILGTHARKSSSLPIKIDLSSYVNSVTTSCRLQFPVSTSSLVQTSGILMPNRSGNTAAARNIDSPALVRGLSTSTVKAASLNQMHRTGPIKKIRPNKNPLVDKPMAKGLVLKTLIKKPRKPNSANRKCVLVRLSNGKEMVAYVPGQGHNLQEHNIVMVKNGRLRDTPGVKIRCIRGVYDLSHVVKRKM